MIYYFSNTTTPSESVKLDSSKLKNFCTEEDNNKRPYNLSKIDNQGVVDFLISHLHYSHSSFVAKGFGDLYEQRIYSSQAQAAIDSKYEYLNLLWLDDYFVSSRCHFSCDDLIGLIDAIACSKLEFYDLAIAESKKDKVELTKCLIGFILQHFHLDINATPAEKKKICRHVMKFVIDDIDKFYPATLRNLIDTIENRFGKECHKILCKAMLNSKGDPKFLDIAVYLLPHIRSGNANKTTPKAIMEYMETLSSKTLRIVFSNKVGDQTLIDYLLSNISFVAGPMMLALLKELDDSGRVSADLTIGHYLDNGSPRASFMRLFGSDYSSFPEVEHWLKKYFKKYLSGLTQSEQLEFLHSLGSSSRYDYISSRIYKNDNDKICEAYFEFFDGNVPDWLFLDATYNNATKIARKTMLADNFDIHTEPQYGYIKDWKSLSGNSIPNEALQVIAEALIEDGYFDSMSIEDFFALAEKIRKPILPVLKIADQKLGGKFYQQNMDIKGIKVARLAMTIFDKSPMELLANVTKQDTKLRLLRQLS